MGYRVGLSCLGKGGIRNMEMGKWRVKEGGRARHRDAQLGPYEARSGGGTSRAGVEESAAGVICVCEHKCVFMWKVSRAGVKT